MSGSSVKKNKKITKSSSKQKIILVLNSGSSSLKFKVIKMPKEEILVEGDVDAIGSKSSQLIVDGARIKKYFPNHERAIKEVLAILEKYTIDFIGHRVVHGGEKFKQVTKITSKVIDDIKKLSVLAPLHNPVNLKGILACKKLLPKIPQFAVFDTSFHQTIPEKAFLYAIPLDFYKKYKIRKYGFHGTSHKFVSLESAKILSRKNPNLITCHLGNGSSITAIRKGLSVDTSMGFTPLQGLIMGTRSGDLDPGIIPFLEKQTRYSAKEIENLLNKKSGLLGIDGYSDMRLIHKKAIAGNKLCNLAIEMLAYDIVKYIGSYLMLTSPLDAIVFTGGMGEHAYYIRKKVLDYLKPLGVRINNSANKRDLQIISTEDSSVKVLVLETNEELMIAREIFSEFC